jgi:hypothetical protein
VPEVRLDGIELRTPLFSSIALPIVFGPTVTISVFRASCCHALIWFITNGMAMAETIATTATVTNISIRVIPLVFLDGFVFMMKLPLG